MVRERPCCVRTSQFCSTTPLHANFVLAEVKFGLQRHWITKARFVLAETGDVVLRVKQGRMWVAKEEVLDA